MQEAYSYQKCKGHWYCHFKRTKKKKKNVFDVMPEDGFARKDRKTMTDSLCNDFGKRSESRSYCWKANGQIYIVEPGYPRQRTCLSIKKNVPKYYIDSQ